MESYFHGLTNSENPKPNKVGSPSCISECYLEELWKFDEAVEMAQDIVCDDGKNNWSAD